MKHFTKLLFSVLGMVLFSSYAFAQDPNPKLDSTVVYQFTSATDSVEFTRDYYKMYNGADYVTNILQSDWNTSAWADAAEKNYVYDVSNVLLSFEQLNADYLGNRRIEYTYTNSNLTTEIGYFNLYDGVVTDVEWIRLLKKEYQYDLDDNATVINSSAFLGYWQGVSRTENTYTTGNLTTQEIYSAYPHVKVRVTDGLFGEAPDGTTYSFTAYMVENTTLLADLMEFTVSADVEFLNVYYNDGADGRYDLHGVAGKTLKEIFEGSNTENQVVDISQLRGDYFEWFQLGEGKVSLVNCNIKAGTTLEPTEVVEITENLSSENSGGTKYNNTAYFVKGIATMDNLAAITFPTDIEWASVYLKEDPNDPNADYGRVDLTDVAGKTLKLAFEENAIAIADLATDYVEWFQDAEGKQTLVSLNIKAMKVVVDPADKVTIYENLYSSGEVDDYKTTGYMVHAGATLTDLETIVLADDTNWISIYYNDGSTDQRLDLNGVAGKTLKAVFEGNSDEGTVVDIATLRSDYVEWFYNAEGKITLVNLNVKAIHNLGEGNKVEVTENLFASGSEVQKVTAYFVHSNAAESDLSQYVLTGIDWISVYVMDGLSKVRHDLTGVEGKTLEVAITAAGNNEGITIDISKLRNAYYEWFKDADDRPTLVNLNIKAIEILGAADHVVVTGGLINTSGTTTFENTAYLVEYFAVEADLANHTIANDVQLLNVYTNDGTNDVRYSLHGVAGKTLAVALTSAGNDENIDIVFDELRDDYVEWFSLDGKAELVQLNIKAVKQISDIDRLKQKNDFTYNGDNMVATSIETNYDDGGVQEGNLTKTEFTYSTDGLVKEEAFTSTDGVVWAEVSKNEYTYKGGGYLDYVTSFTYTSQYDIDTREFYYCPTVVQTITNNDAIVCDGSAIDVDYATSAVGGVISVQAVYPTGVTGSVDYSTLTALGASGKLAETLANTTSTPLTVTYTFYSTASGCYIGLEESVDVVVNPIPTFTNLPAAATVASGTTLDFLPTSDVAGTAFSWTSTVTGDITGNTSVGDGKIADILNNTGRISDGTVTYTITATGPDPESCVNSTTADYVVTVNIDPVLAIGMEDVVSTNVYPNPVGNVLNISIKDNSPYEYKIFSLKGELMIKGRASKSNISVDVSQLKDGVYVLKINNGKKLYTNKFIK